MVESSSSYAPPNHTAVAPRSRVGSRVCGRGHLELRVTIRTLPSLKQAISTSTVDHSLHVHQMLGKLMAFWSFRRERFSALERWLIDELLSNTRGPFHDKLVAQVQSVNLVQRDNDGMQIFPYTVIRGKISRDPRIKFRDTRTEVYFAHVNVSLGGTRNRARFLASDGHFVCISFRGPIPRRFRPEDYSILGTWTITDLECTKTVDEDTLPPKPEVEGYLDSEVVIGCLASWMKSHELTFVLLDPLERREVCLGAQWYLLIAEVPTEGMVGLRQGDATPTCYYMAYDGSTPVVIQDCNSSRDSIRREGQKL